MTRYVDPDTGEVFTAWGEIVTPERFDEADRRFIIDEYIRERVEIAMAANRRHEGEPSERVAHLITELENATESSDWFSIQLLRLIQKADVENTERIRYGFPDHVEAFERWHQR